MSDRDRPMSNCVLSIPASRHFRVLTPKFDFVDCFLSGTSGDIPSYGVFGYNENAGHSVISPRLEFYFGAQTGFVCFVFQGKMLQAGGFFGVSKYVARSRG